MSEKMENLPLYDDLVIRATSDLFIASLLSAPKNEPILCEIINAVLQNSDQTPIVSAKVLNPFNIKEFALEKRIILDVRVEDENGRFFNVEIQTSPHSAFLERILFGWADTFSAQLHAGDGYDELAPVICIVITEFKIFGDLEQPHLIFELRERHHHDLLMSGHIQIHVLRLFGLLKGGPETLVGVSRLLYNWMLFWALGGTIKEEEMSQLVDNTTLWS